VRILKYLALLLWLALGAPEAPGADAAGVGVVLGVEGQNIVIKRIIPDSPAAAQKDIHVGDRIMAIAQDKEPPVQIRNLAQAVPLLRGAAGTTVRLTLVSEDDSRARVVSFVRAELKALAPWGDGALLPNGTKAPDIEMAGLANGKSERLSNYGGKILVLEFWATWCGPCQETMADLQTYSGKYPDWKESVILIAANVDTNQVAASKHVKAKGWDKTHHVWVGTDAIKAFHVEAIPTAYIIDRQGKILAANPRDLPGIVNQELLK
jgi:thiol-disulfide isomerase/thioredoxin